MKKENQFVILTGVVIGIAALVLTALGNPANMGFCIACFERDIAGAVGLHSAAKVQYVRPEIIGLVLGSFLMAIATKEWKAKAEIGHDPSGCGRGEWWEIEPDVGRLAHGIPHRVDRLKGLGNAIVPQIAELLFRQIREIL